MRNRSATYLKRLVGLILVRSAATDPAFATTIAMDIEHELSASSAALIAVTSLLKSAFLRS
jgi:hypothetical protein